MGHLSNRGKEEPDTTGHSTMHTLFCHDWHTLGAGDRKLVLVHNSSGLTACGGLTGFGTQTGKPYVAWKMTGKKIKKSTNLTPHGNQV